MGQMEPISRPSAMELINNYYQNNIITGDIPVDDRVNHPSHYTFGKIEVADAIVDWKLDFLRGNVVKYVARAGKKKEADMTSSQKEIQDLEKALWYLNRAIKELKDNK